MQDGTEPTDLDWPWVQRETRWHIRSLLASLCACARERSSSFVFSGVLGNVFTVPDSGVRLESEASGGQAPQRCRQDIVQEFYQSIRPVHVP